MQLGEDLQGSNYQLKKVRLENLNSSQIYNLGLTTSSAGYIAFDTDIKKVFIWTGTLGYYLTNFIPENILTQNSGTGESVYYDISVVNGEKRIYTKGIKGDSAYISATTTGTDIVISLNAAGVAKLLPLTTKGDIPVYGTVNSRLPVGTNGQVLTADSTQTLGVKWSTPTTGSSLPADPNSSLFLSWDDTNNVAVWNTKAVNRSDGVGIFSVNSSSGSTVGGSYAIVADASVQLCTNPRTDGEAGYITVTRDVITITARYQTTYPPSIVVNSGFRAGSPYGTTEGFTQIKGKLKLSDYSATAPVVGQVWTCTNIDGSGAWQTIGGGSSPLTTKGDVYTYSTANARLPVGTNGQVLMADSTTATGLKWATNTPTLPTTTKGDLIVRNSTVNTRIGVGIDGYRLIADSMNANGMRWGAPDTADVQYSTPDIQVRFYQDKIVGYVELDGSCDNLVIREIPVDVECTLHILNRTGGTIALGLNRFTANVTYAFANPALIRNDCVHVARIVRSSPNEIGTIEITTQLYRI